MTNITRWTTKDIDKIFDAATRYSVGFDDLFDRFHAYGTGSVQGQYPPYNICLLYTSPSPRDPKTSRMPSSA